MTMAKPIACRKCRGSGIFTRASGMPDSCSWCVGAGVVEGDKATNDARKVRQAEFNRLYPILMELASKEPARYTKAVASLEAGHPQVVQALSDYFFANH